MNSRAKIIISVAIVVSVISVGFSVYSLNSKNNLEDKMRYTEERAYSELVTNVSKLETALKKAPLATSPSYASTLYAEIWKQAESAKYNLADLSSEEIDTTSVQDFIAKTGDFALYMLRKTSSGEDVTQSEKESLYSFSNTLNELTIELSENKMAYDDDGGAYFTEFSTFTNEVNASGDMDSENQIDQNFGEFATMIYDGPFSSHIDKMQPALLEGEKEISKDEALELVAKFLETEPHEVEFVSKVSSKIPFYKFRSSKEDDEISIDITVKGGHIINYTNYREIGTETLDANGAVEKALELMKSYGYENFTQTYYIDKNGIVTINFAFIQDDVIMYPDLLKISIFKDDGTLAGVEAKGFIMSHTERSDVTPTITIEEARKKVSPELTILKEGKAIIPTSGKNEVLTYEFKCENENGEHYIVYINAKTNVCENILILIEESSGTLAM